VEPSPNAADPEVLKKLGVGQRRKARRWLFRALWVLVLVGIGTGVFVWRARAGQDKAQSWVTAQVEQGDLRETVTATGTLSPLDSVEIGAEVTGRVTKVHVDINEQVKADQILVELDTEPLEARVEESQAQLRSAQASYKSTKTSVVEAEAKAKRMRELHKRGLASDQDLETTEAALDRAKAQVSTSSAQISLARAGMKTALTSKSKAIIRSPIDGIVLARTVEVGQTVTSGLQTPVLFTVARDLTKMQLKIDVDEADVGKVQEGQRATFVVDAHPNRRFSSKVVRLSNLPKAGTTVITYEAVLTVDNTDRLLRPGMTATATVVTNEINDVLLVPNAALRFQPDQAGGAGSARNQRGAGLPIPGMGGGMRGMRGGGMRGGGGPRGGGGDGDRGARPAGSAERPRGNAERKRREAVWVVKGNALERLSVEVGATDGRRTEVKGEGVTPGLQVVVDVAEAEE
jgi:HlyD family secretion protein